MKFKKLFLANIILSAVSQTLIYAAALNTLVSSYGVSLYNGGYKEGITEVAYRSTYMLIVVLCLIVYLAYLILNYYFCKKNNKLGLIILDAIGCITLVGALIFNIVALF